MKKFLPLLLLFLSCQLQAEEITLEHDGLKLTANLEQAGEAWRTGAVILMTHGTLAHNRMEIVATLQELFLDRDISSLAINLSLGLSAREGMYDCSVPHTHRHTDALDEIGLWLDWLEKQGVESVVLLGHSRGGNQTAWFTAERDRPAITKLVLIAPQVWSEDKNTRGYQESYGKALQPLLAKAKQLVAEGKGDTMLQPIDFIYCPDSSASAAAFVSYYEADERMDTPTLLGHLDKPVLVFVGSADKVVEGLAPKLETITRENIRFEVLDGADHFFRDLYAEDLADMAHEFISED